MRTGVQTEVVEGPLKVRDVLAYTQVQRTPCHPVGSKHQLLAPGQHQRAYACTLLVALARMAHWLQAARMALCSALCLQEPPVGQAAGTRAPHVPPLLPSLPCPSSFVLLCIMAQLVTDTRSLDSSTPPPPFFRLYPAHLA